MLGRAKAPISRQGRGTSSELLGRGQPVPSPPARDRVYGSAVSKLVQRGHGAQSRPLKGFLAFYRGARWPPLKLVGGDVVGHDPFGPPWVILRRRCDRLCTSGFMDDVMFVHDGPQEWATSLRTQTHKLAVVSNDGASVRCLRTAHRSLIASTRCTRQRSIATSVSVCLSVCLSVRVHISKTGRPTFTESPAHVASGSY